MINIVTTLTNSPHGENKNDYSQGNMTQTLLKKRKLNDSVILMEDGKTHKTGSWRPRQHGWSLNIDL